MNRQPPVHRYGPRPWLKLVLAISLLLVASIPAAGRAAQPANLNSAGLVIKHGDGTVLYFYVQFSEPEITGTQLLERAGVQIDLTPYAGIGEAICRIDGEGCPPTDCFCKSFANPSVYWRYNKLGPNGNWVYLASGPDARKVHNGDVDGWSWSSKEGDLPSVTLAQIAKINGITLTATPAPPTATRATSQRASTQNATAPPASASVARSTATGQPIAARSTASAYPVVVGAEVKPSGQTVTVSTTNRQTGHSKLTYLWFAGALVLLMLAAGAVMLRRRRTNR